MANVPVRERYGYAKPTPPPYFPPGDYDFGLVAEQVLRDSADQDANSFFRLYDLAMMAWIRDSTRLQGKRLPVVFASPRNAFSTYRDLLTEKGYKGALDTVHAFPLPFASLHFKGHSPRPGYQQSMVVRNIGTLTADNKRGAYSRHPKPLWFNYQVELWTKYRSHHQYVGQMLEEQFWDVCAWTYVTHPHEDGAPMLCCIHKENVTDNSDLTPEENRDVIYRWTYDLKVEAWQFFDLMSAPLFHTLLLDFIQVDGTGEDAEETDLASVAISESDVTVVTGGGGGTGWSPVLAVSVRGDKALLKVVDWIGGSGPHPATGLYVGASGYVTDPDAAVDVRGSEGHRGTASWTPVMAVVEDGDRCVVTVTDWTGGGGTKPDSNVYLGPTGLTSDISEATDIRGEGWTPVLAVVEDGERRVQQVVDWLET